MRSTPWLALVFPLLALLASPSEAREPSAARVLQQRTVHWAPGAEPVELHVAPGAPTLVRLEAFPELGSLELTEGRTHVRLVPLGGASFILVPSSDFAASERAFVTVRLGPPELTVSLLLVSRENAVDGEVRLVRLRAPTPDELEVDSVARVLGATPLGRVSLAEEGPWLKGSMVNVHVESILRLDSHVFVTLALCPIEMDGEPWRLERARLQAVLEDGAQVELPQRLVPMPMKRDKQRYTLVAPLPERFQHLLLAVEGQGGPEGFFPLPSGVEAPSP